MSEEKLQISTTPAIKVLSEREGLVEYVASDESVDSGRDVILASGWTFDRLSKNPAFVDSHNYWGISSSLGSLQSWRVDREARQLINVAKWAIDVPENDLAALGFAMTKAGHLKACSIGAMVTAQAFRGDDQFAARLDETRLSDEAKREVRRVIHGQDQYELSACIIGANPNALCAALKSGDVAEELAARVGFDSDDRLGELELAAEVFNKDGIPAEVREGARLRMASIFQAGLKTRKNHANSGDEESRQAADRQAARERERRQAWMQQTLDALKACR